MRFLKQIKLINLVLVIIFITIAGCDFDNPYVPSTAGSSTLTGRIVTDPVIDLAGAEVVLRGQDSFAGITDASGTFLFRDIPPGDYSLYIQKSPYLNETFTVKVRKSTSEDMGNINIKLKGAISGTIPNDKISIIHGEVEIEVYINGVPFVTQQNSDNTTIELSSTESNISIRAATKITVYIDNIPYSAIVQDGKTFIIEFIPPGVYSDIRVKLDSAENSFPVISNSPIVVKSGQTRFLTYTP